MDNQQSNAALLALNELSFRVLMTEDARHSHGDEVLKIIQDMLNIESASLLIWDKELVSFYPFAVCGEQGRAIFQDIDKFDPTIWSGEQVQQGDKGLVFTAPVVISGERIGLLAVLDMPEVDKPLLESAIKALSHFLLCVDSARKSFVLKKKTQELELAKQNLENTFKVNVAAQSELEKLAVQLSQSVEIAEKASRAKSEFLSSMSHELKTPLNAILGFTQLLQNSPLNSDQMDNAKEITHAGQHLLTMVDEMLELARLQADSVEVIKTETNLAILVASCVDLMKPLASEQQIVISNEIVDLDQLVIADEHKLKQVLINLLSNAVKFNHVGGAIKLACQHIGNNRLKVSISDTGQGISEHDIDKLFHMFERLNASDKFIEGTGIGLSVCKQLIEKMGGEIGVESVVDEGSCFWFILPFPA